ncbi:MAG: hypothetical protein ABI859_16250 [Pseudomonadota bacterium]
MFSASRRHLLAASGAVVAGGLPIASSAAAVSISDADVAALMKDLDAGSHAWISGHLESTANKLMAQDDDMTIFGPFGGEAGRGNATLIPIQTRVVAAFRGGTGSFEVTKIMHDGDLLVIAMIERNSVMFEGHTEPHPWVLRTTQVFRRDKPGHWLRLHRHADPLVMRRDLTETLALLK